jgi:hypothetical protein
MENLNIEKFKSLKQKYYQRSLYSAPLYTLPDKNEYQKQYKTEREAKKKREKAARKKQTRIPQVT